MDKRPKRNLREKWVCFATNNQRFSRESAEYSKAYLLNTVLLLMAAITLIFTFADALLLDLLFASFVNFISFVSALTVMIYFHKTDNLEKASLTGVIILFVTLVFSNHSVDYIVNNYIWACIFPLGAYSLLGNKKGSILSSLFWGYLLLALYLNFDAYNLTEILNIIFAYASIMILVSYNEKSKRDAFRNLEEKNRMLDQLTITDALTGLGNRLLVEKELAREIARAGRTGSIFTIILLDLDKFKQINDNEGHLVGDRVLRETAKLLRKTCRETDLIARWGGDEFLIICPETDSEQAIILAERISMNISQNYFSDIKGLTISYGVAEYSSLISEDSLLKRADEELYFTKKKKLEA